MLPLLQLLLLLLALASRAPAHGVHAQRAAHVWGGSGALHACATLLDSTSTPESRLQCWGCVLGLAESLPRARARSLA